MLSSLSPSRFTPFWFSILLAGVVPLIHLAGCAGQLPPSGGPEDRIPPKIISTYPAPYTTRFTDRRIAIEFDEYVDKRTVQESVFISPFVGDLEFDWSGTEVEITFSEQLRENTTYVVNIGTDVVDLRGKNRMAQAFTLAFSTGDQIDRGVIGGRVYPLKEGDKVEGVMIFAYDLTSVAVDTLDPKATQPDFITQTGQNGDFMLQHLRLGKYRLLAVRDEFRNLLYDPETDEYAVPAFDILLTESDTAHFGVNMRLAKEDTTAPRLIKISVPDRNHLIAEFSEPIDTSGLHVSQFQIVDTVARTPLAVLLVSSRPTNLAEVFVVTDGQQPEQPYRLTVSGVKDQGGIIINSLAQSLGFVGSADEDTVGPAVSFSWRDSTQGIQLRPTIFAYFSDAVRLDVPTDFVKLSDSSRQPIAIQWRWVNSITLEAKPLRALSSKMWYTFAVDLSRLTDLGGNNGRDTTQLLRFETLTVEQLSGIEGIVTDMVKSDTLGGVVIRARNVSTKEPTLYETRIAKPGKFVFDEIIEGRYVLEAYRDRNNDGKFTAGLPIPFQPAERFTVYRDTLKLRARWPLDGVKIELK